MKKTFLTVLGGLLLAAVLFVLYTAVGLWLWNVIAVAVFGLPTLTFWQFYGLMWLCKFLFDHKSYTKFSFDD